MVFSSSTASLLVAIFIFLRWIELLFFIERGSCLVFVNHYRNSFEEEKMKRSSLWLIVDLDGFAMRNNNENHEDCSRFGACIDYRWSFLGSCKVNLIGKMFPERDSLTRPRYRVPVLVRYRTVQGAGTVRRTISSETQSFRFLVLLNNS